MRDLLLSVYRSYPFRILSFWLILFFVFRFIFFLVYYSKLEGGFFHSSAAFFAALRVDLSLAAYISALPVIFWLAGNMTGKNIFRKLSSGYNFLVILLVITILLSNIGLYGSWGTMINRRLVLYLENPSEISHFMDTWKLIALPVVIGLLTWLFYKFYSRWIRSSRIEYSFKQSLLLPLAIIPLHIVMMRGGLQLVAVNESNACYSLFPANNHVAINPVFYFAHSVSEYFYLENKYNFLATEEANKIVTDYLGKKEDSFIPDSVLSVAEPNVVIIMLESWTADVLEKAGGLAGVTPFTDSLVNESLLFTSAYSSGYRTDQGLVSILSGYPSQPDNTIISYPAKTEKLPTISDELKSRGYHTSFFYGGDIAFANMKSYLSQHHFDVIEDKNGFPSEEYNSKWGAHDGAVFKKQLDHLRNEKTPFFSCILTLSTHEPFEVPMDTPFDGSEEPEKFKKSAWYTDQCLSAFFRDARKESWYDNTLFVLVADHGHYLPQNRDLNKKESKKITMLFTGEVLKETYIGKKEDKPVAQHDLAATLLELLKIKSDQFRWSRNIFTSKNSFAYFCNENVAGIITGSGEYSYYFNTKIEEGNPELSDLAKAYLQLTYQDFVEK